jgi:ABC-type transporter Mla MlaB component
MHTEPATNETTIILNGAATFVRLPKLAAALESIPTGTSVKLDIDGLSYIDHACLDLIANWRKQHLAREGQAEVPLADLQQRYHEREQTTLSSIAPPLAAEAGR